MDASTQTTMTLFLGSILPQIVTHLIGMRLANNALPVDTSFFYRYVPDRRWTAH
jgi:hypothetical protein